MYDYTQENKKFVRHTVLSQAVNNLTVDRQQICCVPRTYVRKVVDYFSQLDSAERRYEETQQIDANYITSWESLHDAIIGHRRPSELSVCYLSGPQPENDFDKLYSLGVLPQNIWAFENDRLTYLEALSKYNNKSFPQPKIVKMPIERFFKHSPRKFDIVYIDACGSITSSQHALRCVSSLFYYQRLHSPGVLITNFSKPDISKENTAHEYATMIALYQLFKAQPNVGITCIQGTPLSKSFDTMYQEVLSNFNRYYGEFITSLISDLAAIIIPLQRFGELAQFSNLFSENELRYCDRQVTLEVINNVKYNSTCRWLLFLDWLVHAPEIDNFLLFNKSSLFNDLVGLDGNWERLIKGVKLYIELKNGSLGKNKGIIELRTFFDRSNVFYQFLDKVTSSLFFDVVINQLTYPMHSNTEKCSTFLYCAKETDMFTDVATFDECRYLYEWLPALHQIKNAMNDKSWQYVFRFSLDALVKQRLNYNNEFFFQGSVISKNESGFQAKVRQDRKIIGG